MPAAWQCDPRDNLNDTGIWHRDVPTAHEPIARCDPKAPRRHYLLCDGVVFEFGIDFNMLARCPRLGSMIRETINLNDTRT